MFLISHETVTLNKNQGHPNWYQYVLELSGLYYHDNLKENGQ